MVNFLCSFAIHNIRKCEMRQREKILTVTDQKITILTV